MKQLSGLDAAFYHQDSQRTPMHVTAVLIYSSVDANTALTERRLADVMAHAGSRYEFINHKLVDHTMGIEEPYWVRDNNFLATNHISEQQLPLPGNWTQLKDLAGRIHSRQMTREQPLWDLTIIRGIGSTDFCSTNSVALVFRFHHAVADGVSLAGFLAWLHENYETELPKTLQKRVNEKLDIFSLWQRSSTKSWARPLRLAKTISDILPRMNSEAGANQLERADTSIANIKTQFNEKISGARLVGAVQLPFQEIREIKKNIRRVTLNDIALGVVSGALREYLASHDALPETSIVSGVPISLRSKGMNKKGNDISMMQVGLASEIDDPVERVRAIHEYALAGKAKTEILGNKLLQDISDGMAPAMLAQGIKLLSFATMATELPVPFHTLISNVPGSVIPVSLGTNPLVAQFGLGPLRDNMGLFHIVTNTDTNFAISFCSCEDMMADPDFYEECLKQSFTNLLNASRKC